MKHSNKVRLTRAKQTGTDELGYFLDCFNGRMYPMSRKTLHNWRAYHRGIGNDAFKDHCRSRHHDHQ